jgi:hypothetical protein
MVLWNCVAIGLSWLYAPANAASGPPPSPGQEQPGMSSDLSGMSRKYRTGNGVKDVLEGRPAPTM